MGQKQWLGLKKASIAGVATVLNGYFRSLVRASQWGLPFIAVNKVPAEGKKRNRTDLPTAPRQFPGERRNEAVEAAGA